MSTLLDLVFAYMEGKTRLLHQWSVTDRLLHSTVLYMSNNQIFLIHSWSTSYDRASGLECNLYVSVIRKLQGKGSLNIIYQL